MYQIMLHHVFHSCSSTLDLSFFMMLLSICEPLLCAFDTSWWSRHIDFQVYTIKLQPGFCISCVLQCFSYFEPTFCMMSCLTLQSQPCLPLCLLCESAHRLRDLLSSLQICKRVVHDILKKLLAICETVFTFLCVHCPNCRTVVSSAMVQHVDFDTSCLLCESVSELYKTSSNNFRGFVELWSLSGAPIVRIAKLW